MQPPFEGPFGFGGPHHGFGRHGRRFGGFFGGAFGQPPTAEQQAFWQEANALRHQLMATVSATQADPATLTKVKEILAQARIALASLASQPGTKTQGGETSQTTQL
jgi:hypothetical protein